MDTSKGTAQNRTDSRTDICGYAQPHMTPEPDPAPVLDRTNAEHLETDLILKKRNSTETQKQDRLTNSPAARSAFTRTVTKTNTRRL